MSGRNSRPKSYGNDHTQTVSTKAGFNRDFAELRRDAAELFGRTPKWKMMAGSCRVSNKANRSKVTLAPVKYPPERAA